MKFEIYQEFNVEHIFDMTQSEWGGLSFICADADFPLRNKEAINYMMGSNKLFIFNNPPLTERERERLVTTISSSLTLLIFSDYNGNDGS
jgi:hypothetical protein